MPTIMMVLLVMLMMLPVMEMVIGMAMLMVMVMTMVVSTTTTTTTATTTRVMMMMMMFKLSMIIIDDQPVQRGRAGPRHLAKGTPIITTTKSIKKQRKQATHSKTKSDPQDTPDDKLYNISWVLSNSR